jgi:RNA polymerase sigma factor (sigma-70 family)
VDTLVRLCRELPGLDGEPDHTLLDRYRSGRDERAFAELLRRHGPMVLGVCRRVLSHTQDAEDAFQATFLVLAKKARSIRHPSVGSWLYGVASRLAKQAKREARRREQREQKAARPECIEDDGREVLQVLDEELRRLPESNRAPLLLCHLAGLTQEEAARRLGWSFSTLRRRLAQGRERLRTRLARRGVAPAVAALAAPVPASLARSTALAARFAGRPSLAPFVTPQVLVLTEQGVRPMTANLKLAAFALVCLAGAALYAQQPAQNRGSDPYRGGDATSPSGQNPFGGRGAPQGRLDPDQRLADMEQRLEGLLADVKALRKDLKKNSADTAVLKLKHVEASQAAKMLGAVFEGRGEVRVTYDAQTNSIFIQAGEKELKEARKIVEVLDEAKPALNQK